MGYPSYGPHYGPLNGGGVVRSGGHHQHHYRHGPDVHTWGLP